MGSSHQTPSSTVGSAQLDQEVLEPHWGLGVYQRVFLTESAAKAWYSWNSMRGDPAQPFHYQHLVQQVQTQVGGVCSQLSTHGGSSCLCFVN